MKKLIFIFLILNCNIIIAQNISLDVNYSGLISSSNNESASLYSLEGNYEFLNNDLSIGISAAVLDAIILKNFIAHSPPQNVDETSTILGITGKYYPSFLRAGSHIFKPYMELDLGLYLHQITFGISGNLRPCEASYVFSISNNYYINFVIGTIIYPKRTVNLIINLKYQIFSPEVTYKKPSCFIESPTIYTEYKEKVNLSILLWSLGVQINL